MSILQDWDRIEAFKTELYEKVTDGAKDADHPKCPDCGAIMDFKGHDEKGPFPLGDGYWVCPSCGFNITEDDLY